MIESELLWPNQAFLQTLGVKHRKLQVQVDKTKRAFFARHNDQSQLVVTEHLYASLESLRLDFDSIVLEVSEDINFLHLPCVGSTINSLFECMSTIQQTLVMRNKQLALICDAHRRRGELEQIKPKVCQYCMKHVEMAKLKDLLPQTTFATHEYTSFPHQSSDDVEKCLKKLDLDRFYGTDQDILMKKISQLLNEKSASLSKKAADTEQTLQSILSDLFNKNSGDAIGIDEPPSDVDEDSLDIDVAHELTNTMKSELLKHAGQPLKKYIEIVSETRMKRLIKMRSESMVSVSIQTMEVKTIEQIKSLEMNLKRVNTQLQGRKQRTQEVEKQLMAELLEVERCKRRLGEAEQKLIEQQKANKKLQVTRDAYQQQLERVFTDKQKQKEQIKKQANEEQRELKREMQKLYQQLENTKRLLVEKNVKVQEVDQMGVQTVFDRNNQQTQTQQTRSVLRNAIGRSNSSYRRSDRIKKKVVLVENDKASSSDRDDEMELADHLTTKSNHSLKLVKTQKSLQSRKSNPLNLINAKDMAATSRKLMSSGRYSSQEKKAPLLEQALLEVKNQFSIKETEALAPKRQSSPFKASKTERSVFDAALAAIPSVKEHEETREVHFRNVTEPNEPVVPCNLDSNQQESHDSAFEAGARETAVENSKKFMKEKIFIKKLSRTLNKFHVQPIKKKKVQPIVQLTEQHEQHEQQQPKQTRERAIEEEAEELKDVLVREYQFLTKIGIIGMLENLRSKKVERFNTEFNHTRRRNACFNLLMRPMKVNYPQRADIPIKFTSGDLELFGGYQGAIKYILKKGIYENELLVLDNYSHQIARIMKAIDSIEDSKKALLIKNFLINPIDTVVHQAVAGPVRTESLKLSLKRLFKFHSYCKPRCDHIWAFFQKHGLVV